MPTGFISHSDCLKHEMGNYHPECPERLTAIEDQLLLSRINDFLIKLTPPLATEENLNLVHSKEHIEFVKSIRPSAGYAEIDGDTLMNPHSWNAALRAAGAGLLAVDAIMNKELVNAFCSVRPPGHHAEPNKAMGFCFFNNLAIAAKYAVSKYAIQRVAIIDFDVHHGNGTEHAFMQDERFLMCSFFQHPLFPYSGTNNTAKNMLNTPVPAFTNGQTIRQLVEEHWLPRLNEFKPEFIFISAGFDAHREDELGQMGLIESDYAWLTQQIVAIAKQYAQGRIVSCLEGGYNLSALSRSVVAHIKELAEI
ncbi:histone deacetylase family protein [Polynucleobacter kasalickyi]|uniref:Acetoin utilization deacetylase AcuC n=1 Tax=Polynucleobacter kasalickyi TaxID=1938817 RepID=A0A1W1YBC2_9BURK|nr:histone deacetylase family protein [Polynucleobacter kasalickyi]SMC33472.1 Acetoin utilization deacetylase AcuC [Polynucleobacter kasalickyi]